MKILIAITSLGVGGAENVVVNLAEELYARGHQVKILYLTGEALIKPKNANIELINLNMNKGLDFPKVYLRTRKIIKSFKPDIVHSHMYHANILCRLVRIRSEIPKLICTSHSNFEGGMLRMLSYRATDKLATISTNVSQDAMHTLINKGAYKANRVIAIPNGINTEKFIYDENSRKQLRTALKSQNKKVILAVGRMSPAKDYSNLFKSIALLKQQRNDFIVYTVGDGPLREELNQLAQSLDINDYIIMLGVRYDVPELMSACDVFVLSSAWEGFGLVVAEAMSCERLVVATDCGGVKDIVGQNGILVEPKNYKKLSQALNKALDTDINTKRIIGLAARQHIQNNFSLEKSINSYLELYEE